MLSSHCDNNLLMPYALPPPAAARRPVVAAALLDHRRYHRANAEVAAAAPSCPRCDSPNTKFCYYNNYSLSQPRYFCKACRRYWTKGGSLRNVPVGGGCRKNRRGKPVRAAIAVDDDHAVAATGGASGQHRSPSSLSATTMRPDLLLEAGMIGGGGSPIGGLCHQPTTAAAAAENAAPNGSTIDLALLYAKFLNHQPAAAVERCAAAVPEPLDTAAMNASSRSSDVVSPIAVAVVAPPDHHHQPFTTTAQHGFGDLSSAATASAARPPPRCPDELVGAFSVDQRCYDALGLPPDVDGGDLVLLPSTWHLGGAKYEPFDPLPIPEDDMVSVSLQDGGIPGGEEELWSSALACQGLEAALCSRP